MLAASFPLLREPSLIGPRHYQRAQRDNLSGLNQDLCGHCLPTVLGVLAYQAAGVGAQARELQLRNRRAPIGPLRPEVWSQRR